MSHPRKWYFHSQCLENRKFWTGLPCLQYHFTMLLIAKTLYYRVLNQLLWQEHQPDKTGTIPLEWRRPMPIWILVGNGMKIKYIIEIICYIICILNIFSVNNLHIVYNSAYALKSSTSWTPTNLSRPVMGKVKKKICISPSVTESDVFVHNSLVTTLWRSNDIGVT